MTEKNSGQLNNKNNKGRSVSELAMCGLFVALAMIFSYVESLLPIPFPVPAMRLGFANIAIITVLYMYGERDAFAVNLVRIILSAVLFGTINSFLFSISGGLVSLVVMVFIRRIKIFSILGVSTLGGITHNMVQILIAIWTLGSFAIGYLMPIFIVMGLVTGIICGLISRLFMKHVSKLKRN